MTAHDQMRAMLDQLMGTGRNGKWWSFWSSSSSIFLHIYDLVKAIMRVL
jgi:hypothetical protein